MSNLAQAAVAKIVAVFGVGANLTATRKGKEVTYQHEGTKLTLTDAPVEKDGVYNVNVKSDTEVTYEFKEEAKKAEAPQQAAAGRTNSPMGFGARQSR